MRALSFSEVESVNGGLTQGQITYFVSSGAGAIGNFLLNTTLTRTGLVSPGQTSFVIDHLVKPAVGILLGAISTEWCNRYFADSNPKTTEA